ncbi:MAG: hypothetical protein ACOYK6_06150 [Chthoniobacterales bacterium]
MQFNSNFIKPELTVPLLSPQERLTTDSTLRRINNENNSTIQDTTDNHGTYVPPEGATTTFTIPAKNHSIKELPPERNSFLKKIKNYTRSFVAKPDEITAEITNSKIDRETRALYEAISAIKKNSPKALKVAENSVKNILNEDQTYTINYADDPDQKQIWNSAVTAVFEKAHAMIRQEEDNAVIKDVGSRVTNMMNTNYGERGATALNIIKGAIPGKSLIQPPPSDDALQNRARSILAQIAPST